MSLVLCLFPQFHLIVLKEKSIWLGRTQVRWGMRWKKTKSIIFQSKRLLTTPRLSHWIPTLHLFVINRFLWLMVGGVGGGGSTPRSSVYYAIYFIFFLAFFTHSVVLRCRLFIYFCGTINSDINKVSLRIICRQISNRSFLCFLSSFFISLVIGSCAELLFWVYFKLTHLCHLFHFTSSLSTLKDDMSLEDVLVKLNHGGNLIWTLRLTLLSARWQVKL